MAFLAGVAKGSAAGGGSGTSAAISTTGATLIVISLTNTSTPGTVADSQSNTWTALTTDFPGSSLAITLFYCINPSTSASHTFSGGNSFAAITVAAFSNTPGSDSPSESATGATSGTTTIQPGTLTPGSANNIMVTGLGGDAQTTISINAPFTVAASVVLTGGTNYGSGIAYVIQTSATAQNPTWTVGANGSTLGAVMAEFIENGSGGGGSNWGLLLGQQLNRIVVS